MLEVEGMNDGVIKLTLARVLPLGHQDAGEMPIYFFDIRLQDGTRIGHCDLRAGEDERLFYMGQVGYGIWKEYRGHHYALRACRLLMQFARTAGMESLLITCESDNMPSIRTCEALGAQFLGIWDVPEEALDYITGSRQKRRYRLWL